MKNYNKYIFSFLGIFVLSSVLFGRTRIKDVVRIENAYQKQLVGYGLVVGLNGSGDRSSGNRGAVFTVQTISNMLERFGITVQKSQLRTRNVAAVMITSKTPAFGRVGSSFDVLVSSLGDATSLEGGILLMTPLLDSQGNYFGSAQGSISIGGYNIVTGAGENLRKNHALVGRVPNGAILESALPNQDFNIGEPIRLLLNNPDFLTASRISDEINQAFGTKSTNTNGLQENESLAKPVSAGVIEISLPDSVLTQEETVFFIAGVETLQVETDIEARVVINERTGTVVAGGNVVITEVMISHGNLTIHTTQTPIISQPNAFSNTGQTAVVPVTRTVASEETAKTAVIATTTTVNDLASALNQLGLKPRDTIAIFQAIKQAGALNAKLIIM